MEEKLIELALRISYINTFIAIPIYLIIRKNINSIEQAIFAATILGLAYTMIKKTKNQINEAIIYIITNLILCFGLELIG